MLEMIWKCLYMGALNLVLEYTKLRVFPAFVSYALSDLLRLRAFASTHLCAFTPYVSSHFTRLNLYAPYLAPSNWIKNLG